MRDAPDTRGAYTLVLLHCELKHMSPAYPCSSCGVAVCQTAAILCMCSARQQFSSLKIFVWPSNASASESLLAQVLWNCKSYVLLLLLPGV